MQEMADMHIVAGSPDADELAALVAGIKGLVASSGETPPPPVTESEWQRRARPTARGFGIGADTWLWSAR